MIVILSGGEFVFKMENNQGHDLYFLGLLLIYLPTYNTLCLPSQYLPNIDIGF